MVINMRKNRLYFWIVSIVICAIVIVLYKNNENKIPEEEKKEYKVYCTEESFREEIEKFVKGSSIKDTHRVSFTDNKDEAELIFSDKILSSDIGYEKIGWSPLVIAFDYSKDKVEFYNEQGYISEEDDVYTIQFDKIIEATLEGKWKEKIYCPKLQTRRGELFFDFLLININEGRYPISDVEMQECVKKANEFLQSKVVVQLDSTDRLKSKKNVKDELYITFENDVYEINDENCEYGISYPSNTVVHEWYWKCLGENEKEIREHSQKEKWYTSRNDFYDILYYNHIRSKCCTSFNNDGYKSYTESEGFSYVDVPLKEE